MRPSRLFFPGGFLSQTCVWSRLVVACRAQVYISVELFFFRLRTGQDPLVKLINNQPPNRIKKSRTIGLEDQIVPVWSSDLTCRGPNSSDRLRSSFTFGRLNNKRPFIVHIDLQLPMLQSRSHIQVASSRPARCIKRNGA
jgi:hypothetical protein